MRLVDRENRLLVSDFAKPGSLKSVHIKFNTTISNAFPARMVIGFKTEHFFPEGSGVSIGVPEDVGFYENLLECRGYVRGKKTVSLSCSYHKDIRTIVVANLPENQAGNTVMFIVRGFRLPRYQGKIDKPLQVSTFLENRLSDKLDSHSFSLFVAQANRLEFCSVASGSEINSARTHLELSCESDFIDTF
jgi:hypothetical protein